MSSKAHKIKKIREIKDRDKIVYGESIYTYVYDDVLLYTLSILFYRNVNIKSCIEYGLKGWKNVLPDMSSTFCDKEHQMCRDVDI